jgi:FlaG/FlaF family flagellin (archaellin)
MQFCLLFRALTFRYSRGRDPISEADISELRNPCPKSTRLKLVSTSPEGAVIRTIHLYRMNQGLSKNHIERRAATPAIAVMLLLSVTLILAFVVGSFSLGIFGPAVKKVTLTTVALYEGVTSDNESVKGISWLHFSLNNPGQSTTITSISLSEKGLSSPITSWSTTALPQSGNSFSAGNHSALPGGGVSSFTFYPIQNPSVEIDDGQTFDYVIVLENGQTISGSLVAQ